MTDSVSMEQLEEALESTGVHEHLGLIYRNRQEELAAAVRFTRAGLANNDLCVYVADDNSRSEVLEAMEEAGIAVHEEILLGRLVMATKHDSYVKRGYFDPDWAREFFAETAAKARDRGFRALRGNAEMTWQLDGDPGADRIMEYEAKLNSLLFPSHEVVGLCQYRMDRFAPAVIRDVLYTHPWVIVSGVLCRNPYYLPPEEFLAQKGPADVNVEEMLVHIYAEGRREAQRSTEL